MSAENNHSYRKPMLKVKCYGGPAHGREVDLDALTARQSRRFEMLAEPRLPRIPLTAPPQGVFDKLIMLPSRIETNTYYLQRYSQEGVTECRSGVFRQLQAAIVDGADLTVSEYHELEREIDNVPWTWKEVPSILNQFEAWWEKALHDIGWEKARVYH